MGVAFAPRGGREARTVAGTAALKITEALQGVRRVFLDTAPVIYYVERNAAYTTRVDQVFDRLDAGTLMGSTSPVTLAECLVAPMRQGQCRSNRIFAT